MQNCKLQIGCMLIILYVMFIYIREKYMYRYKQKDKMFEALVITGIIMIFFDGTTACTVNYLSVVLDILNRILHLCFLSNIDIFVFIMFLYMLDITKGLPKNKKVRLGIMTPLIVNILIIIIFIPQLSYRKGSITNYSMGISAYTCYAMVMVYIFATIGIFVYRWKNIERHTRIIISTCLITSVAVTIFQMFNPEALITCLVPTLVIIGVYLNKENPLFIKLKKYNKEMVTGFATLVENRDDNTGGHIKRTTEYVRLLAQELKDRGLYKEELTKDYINNLVMAAPMHDVGKIAIPDAILQKPGKLTAEEYESRRHLDTSRMMNMKKWHMKWLCIIMKNGTERDILMGFQKKIFHYVLELWLLQMYLMQYLQRDAIEMHCHLRNVLRLLKMEKERILIRL